MAERRGLLREGGAAGTDAIGLPMIVTGDPGDTPALTSPPPEPPQWRSPPDTDLTDTTHTGTMGTEPGA
jgi:hypothetical protein